IIVLVQEKVCFHDQHKKMKIVGNTYNMNDKMQNCTNYQLHNHHLCRIISLLQKIIYCLLPTDLLFESERESGGTSK
ncbi:MAG: hypothetical protein ACKO96_13735, partial [Flammeovirgaceae bacterium]